MQAQAGCHRGHAVTAGRPRAGEGRFQLIGQQLQSGGAAGEVQRTDVAGRDARLPTACAHRPLEQIMLP